MCYWKKCNYFTQNIYILWRISNRINSISPPSCSVGRGGLDSSLGPKHLSVLFVHIVTIRINKKWNNDKKSTYIDVLCSDDMNIKIANYVVILTMLKTYLDSSLSPLCGMMFYI